MKKRASRQAQNKIGASFRLIFSLLLIVFTLVFAGDLSGFLSGFALGAVGLAGREGEFTTKKENEEPTKASLKEKSDKASDSKPPLSIHKSYLTETPEDVLANMVYLEKDKDKTTTSGTAQEKTFSSKDGTEIYENISIKNTSEQNINIGRILENQLDLKISKNKPLVLIYHTHTSESYSLLASDVFEQGFSGRSLDEDKNVVRVGREIVKELEKAGIPVIHDTEIHDESYNDSYDHSRKSVKKYLEKYPSIQITLDVHRDAIHYNSNTFCRPVANILGKQAAQVMILTGAEGGQIESFPNWEQNLDFAVKLQNYSESLFPSLMRPIMLCQRKYNIDLGRYSLLLEMGADANTLEEAVYSGRLIGNALSSLILDADEASKGR